MGYYTNSLDGVAPKGGHVILGTQIDALYQDRINLFVQILKNEKNNLSLVKDNKKVLDIKKNIEKLEFLLKEEKTDFEDGQDVYLASLVQEEYNRFDYLYCRALYKKTNLETDLNTLKTKKESKGLIRKLFAQFERKNNGPTEEELKNEIEEQNKKADWYYKVLRKEFCELPKAEREYYSFVSARAMLDYVYSNTNLAEIDFKTFNELQKYGVIDNLRTTKDDLNYKNNIAE